jgi:hypothetical protein
MKQAFLHSVFLVVALCSFGQKPIVILEVEPKEAEVGEMLTITVRANVQGEIDVDLPSGFIHGYEIMNGMNQEIDYNTGKVINYFYLSQNGAMPKAGTFKFGPAYVKRGNKVYRSNTVTVTIRKENTAPVTNGNEISAKQLRQPAFGIIEKSKSVIYEGEPLILNAKVYSIFDPSHLEDYQEYKLDGALDKHDITTSSRITVREEKVKRNTYYAFEHDKKVIFPIGTGKFTIEPFKLMLRRGIEGVPITSSSTAIEVKPLPGNAPKDFIGGVGVFTVTSSIDQTKLKQGDVFTLIVEVAGYGNLQNISEPKLNLPKGFVVYGDAIVKEEISFTSRGAEGKITYEYNIQVTKYGELVFPETTLSYFDPIKEQYVQISTEPTSLSVQKNAGFKISDNSTSTLVESKGQDIFPFKTSDEVSTEHSSIVHSPVFWAGVTVPVLFGLFLGLFWRKREENVEHVVKKQEKQQAKVGIQNVFSEAENALSNQDYTNYYGLIEKGLQRSMGLYLRNDDSIILSKSTILEELRLKNVDAAKIAALQQLFTSCEEARYGFGVSPENRDALIVSAKQISQSILKA